MNGKMLLFLGLVVTVIFMYLCIDSKKDELYAQLVETDNLSAVESEIIPQEVKQKVKQPISIVKKPLKEPSFAYISGAKEKIAGILSSQDKESKLLSSIKNICQEDNCLQDIKYQDNIATFNFAKDVLGLITYAKEEPLKNFSLYIDKKRVKLEGKLQNKEQLAQIKPFLQSFLINGYTIENEMQIETPVVRVKKGEIPVKAAPLAKKIIKEETIIEAPRDTFVIPQHISVEEASANINDIIAANNITFEYKSSNISKESKEILNDIIDILLGLDNVTIEVAGYTDSKGEIIYNKVLSQKRADSVRNYLIKSGIRSSILKSKGYGEENFISSPEDTINRRVEIHIKEEK